SAGLLPMPRITLFKLRGRGSAITLPLKVKDRAPALGFGNNSTASSLVSGGGKQLCTIIPSGGTFFTNVVVENRYIRAQTNSSWCSMLIAVISFSQLFNFFSSVFFMASLP